MNILQIAIIATLLLAAAMTPLIIYVRGKKKTLKGFKTALAINVAVFFGAMVFLLIYGMTRGG